MWLDEMPVIKSFLRGYGDDPAKSSQFSDGFYRLMQQVNQINSTINSYRKQGQIDRTLTAEQKRERIDRFMAQRNKLVQQAVERVSPYFNKWCLLVLFYACSDTFSTLSNAWFGRRKIP